jgi:group I intron endonuclease
LQKQKTLLNYKIFIKYYSTLPTEDIPASFYTDAESMKQQILEENKGKSGIYMLTNKITGDIYVGQSTDISKRFRNYFNIGYLNSKSYRINRALVKYGYSNFSLTILEYCSISDLTMREQYYFQKLEPQYNILKIAGSSLGFIHSAETKAKISVSLKGIYIGENSALFGRSHLKKTKELMSLKKAGPNNPLYGKSHNANTKELMRQKALARKHSLETKLKISTRHGNPLNIFEKSSAGFDLIGSFVSARRAAKFLNMSASTIIRYMNSGEIYKNRYKFASLNT